MIFWFYMGLLVIFSCHMITKVSLLPFFLNNNLKQIDLLLIFTFNFLG